MKNNDGKYEIKVYKGPGNSFGYDVWKDGKPLYHEYVMTYVTLEGKRLFASESQVKKGGQLAISRLKKGELPTLSLKDIKQAMSISE